MAECATEHNGPVKDRFGRQITYLRVSVTDRCNMRCVYCMPDDVKFLPAEEILTYEEIARVVKVFAGAGIRKVRLTGGEPLARRDIHTLVAELAGIGEIDELTLTTNGLALEEEAPALARAGLVRVNVSLDTLDAKKFKEICRAGSLDKVVAGIRAANGTGLRPVKINVVVMRGRNETEIGDFLDFAARENATVRFIEYMPLKMDEDWKRLYVPREEMLAAVAGRIARPGRADEDPSAPARYYDVEGAGMRAGFISPVSHGFCSNCNRMRMTPDGRLYSCLLSEKFVDLKKTLRSGGSDADLEADFRRAAAMKGEKGIFTHRPMHSIGG